MKLILCMFAACALAAFGEDVAQEESCHFASCRDSSLLQVHTKEGMAGVLTEEQTGDYTAFENYCAAADDKGCSPTLVTGGNTGESACEQLCTADTTCSAYEWYDNGMLGNGDATQRCYHVLDASRPATQAYPGSRYLDATCYVKKSYGQSVLLKMAGYYCLTMQETTYSYSAMGVDKGDTVTGAFLNKACDVADPSYLWVKQDNGVYKNVGTDMCLKRSSDSCMGRFTAFGTTDCSSDSAGPRINDDGTYFDTAKEDGCGTYYNHPSCGIEVGSSSATGWLRLIVLYKANTGWSKNWEAVR